MIFSRIFYAVAAAAFCCAAFSATCSKADGQPVETFRLRNGMQVVIIPNHRLPIITHMILYRVGAGDDFDGKSGLAHYNEHMMFQGTNKIPAGKFVQVLSNEGGNFNAFTEHDLTAYYVSIAKQHLPLVMELEADRMLNLAPTAANFAKEREVIIEERRMSIENQPAALLSEEMQAMLFRNHPYHTPNIGWMHEMTSLSREDVLAFHRKFYHPANALLVVAGDITRKEIEPLAEKYYGNLAKGEENIRHWRSEPPQRGARHIEIRHRNVRQPEFVRYYVAPNIAGADKELVLPSFLLAQVLGGGSTGRLYQSLAVKQKIASGIEVGYDGIAQGPGMLSIRATPNPGVTLAQLESAIDKEIETYIASGDDNGDLGRAKILLKAETIYSRDSVEGMARTLGTLVMEGLPVDYFNKWPKLVENITYDNVKKAAKAIFVKQNSVTGYLVPDDGGDK